MSEYLSAEIAATCGALGYYDGRTYHLEKDCVETLKDLIRYLRRDDENHTTRRYLGQTKLVQTDLVKILISHCDKEDLFEVNLRLLANLTSPSLLLYNEELPTDKTKRNYYLQIVAHLQGYKAALGDEQFWSVMCTKLGMILNIPNDERPEDKGLVIERILILVRNVLQVPADVESEKRTDSEGTIHDQVLFALHTSGMVDMFLFIASNQDEQQYQMHILEIVSLMLREQSASKLGSAGLQRSTAEKERDEAELLAVRQQENLKKTEKIRKYAGFRHSRFGGTFVVKNMKAIGDREFICNKPFDKLEDLKIGQQKARVKRRKDKLGIQDENPERRSALSVRLFLKEFCVEFLNGAYNPVMRFARSCITGGNRAQANDESYYLWALRFFMEFNRNYKFQVKYVSETISTEIFHLVQKQLEHYYEMMVTDKKKIPLWSRRLHLALKAYRELLHTLMAMDKCNEKAVRDSSKVIKSNVFYVPEYRETLLNQMLCYNELTMSRVYLTDLVETVHIFLKMLESFCAQGKAIIVQRIKSKQRRKAKKKSKTNKEEPAPVNLEQRWDEASSQLSAVMQSSTIPEIVPFDATLDTPIDDQKADAMKRIQGFLRRNEFEEAIGLLRASREVWPENDSFGHTGMREEEEFDALREIYFADLGLVPEDETISGGRNPAARNTENLQNEEDLEDDDEEEYEQRDVEETDFKFTDFLYRFVNVKVVKACSLLLRQFDKNTPEVNHSTVKLLHRIAVQCKTPAMIFQASIFRSFQMILDSDNPQHKELGKFAIFIVRKFAEVAEKNGKAYMELLFWKTTREATEMVEGYGVEVENQKISRTVWTEVEEDELRTLFMEHQTKKYTEDLIDWLLQTIMNDNRTRRSIIKKLKEMRLIVNSKSIRNEVRKRLPKDWDEEEIAQLKEVWEIVKGDNDPVDMIYTELRVKRPKSKIKDKLLELGLATDRKELRKKRSGKNIPGKSEGGSGTESESEKDAGSDSDNQISQKMKPKKKHSVVPRSKKRLVVPRSKKRAEVIYTNSQLSGLLKEVITNNEARDALEWVKESLEDALEDRDEESTEGVPLVPVTDFANAAMDSPSFQRFLRALGIEPPADEQETYWRIPSSMLSSTIRKRTELIADGLAGKFVEEEAPESRAWEFLDEEDDSGDEGADVFESVKKFFAPKSISHEDTASTSGNNFSKISRKGTDSEPEEQEIEEVVSIGSDVAAVDVGWGRRTNTSRIKASNLDSDSEIEIEVQPPQETTPLEDDSKRIRSDNSDQESPIVKKRRLLDSEDEGEGSVAQQPKQQVLLISDDED